MLQGSNNSPHPLFPCTLVFPQVSSPRKAQAFIMLGGNFVRAIPDHGQREPAWRTLRLKVNVITKLNRSAVLHPPGDVDGPVGHRSRRVDGRPGCDLENSGQ